MHTYVDERFRDIRCQLVHRPGNQNLTTRGLAANSNRRDERLAEQSFFIEQWLAGLEANPQRDRFLLRTRIERHQLALYGDGAGHGFRRGPKGQDEAVAGVGYFPSGMVSCSSSQQPIVGLNEDSGPFITEQFELRREVNDVGDLASSTRPA